MNKVVRTSIFETNSSSTHSLVYNNIVGEITPELIRSLKEGLRITAAGTLHLNASGDYGWEFAVYDKALDKLDYIACVYLLNLSRYNEKTQEFDKSEDELLHEPFMQMLMKHLEINSVVYTPASGYIDHAGSKTPMLDAVNNMPDNLFLHWLNSSDKKNAIVTGNDNDDTHRDYIGGISEANTTVIIGDN